MEQGPLVSVLCTCYNHTQFIATALQGFVDQRLNGRIEVIVHDDASTDGSADIIRDFEARYPDVIKGIYQTENQYRLERGRVTRIVYAAARGKYIALCEGDDYWTDPLKLQKQVDALEADPTLSMVFHNVWMRHEQSRYDRFMNQGIKKERFTLADTLASEWFIGTCSMVFRDPREHFGSIGDFAWSRSGDMVLQYHLGLQGDFLYLDEVMGVYRRHDGGASHAIWVDGKHHHEQFLPAQVWLLWRFRGKVPSAEARNALDARMHGLLLRMVRYLMEKAANGNELAMATLRRSLIQLFVESMPPGEPEHTLHEGSLLKEALNTAVSTGWSNGVALLLQRKGKQLGLWSCWMSIARAVLQERYPTMCGIKLMMRCVRWSLA
jgi:glycosyltransferase involved in cell wall biosynthesis